MSRTAKRLQEAVNELRSEPIEGPHTYLYLDATFLKRTLGEEGQERECAPGLRGGPTGHRRLLGITIGEEEPQVSWAELLGQLIERGLTGVELVIASAA